MYTALKKDKETAHAFFDFISEEVGHFALEQTRRGADLITISDPSGTGEILGPKYFEEYMVTYMNKMISIIRTDKNIPIIVHICGQMKKVFTPLAKINADAFSFDAIVSLKEAKEKIQKTGNGEHKHLCIGAFTSRSYKTDGCKQGKEKYRHHCPRLRARYEFKT
nr:uroporphyrinogen decarboxylase family protein [Treponema denticola]